MMAADAPVTAPARKRRVQILLPDHYHQRLRERAQQEGVSASEIVRRELAPYLFGRPKIDRSA